MKCLAIHGLTSRDTQASLLWLYLWLRLFVADGYEQTGKLSELAQALSATYNREIRRCTIKICMIDQIKYPPLGFEGAIREHFCAKGDAILNKVREWEAEDTEDDFQDIYQLRQEAIVAYSAESLQLVLDKMVKLRDKMRQSLETENRLVYERHCHC